MSSETKTSSGSIHRRAKHHVVSSNVTHGRGLKLYVRGVVMSFRRALHSQQQQYALIKIDGVNTTDETAFYLGKRIGYVYKVKNATGSKYRVTWGKVVRSHGNSGVVRARFSHNLPGQALGRSVRVFLYPSRI